MKVKLKEANFKERHDFPCVMQAKELVVLFYSEKTGMVLRDTTDKDVVGAIYSTWPSCFDREEWEPWRGIVTLEF